jgi:transposase, IS30 family
MKLQRGSKKKHLTYEERIKIETLLKRGDTYKVIATALARSTSAIGYEVKGNGGRIVYSAKKAEARAKRKQTYKKKECLKVVRSRFLSRFVEQKLLLGWSPERMAARLAYLQTLAKETEYASAKSIRKFIGKRSGLDSYLYSHIHKKKPGIKSGTWIAESGRRFVDTLPKVTSFGTLQIDFIVSSLSSFVLLVIVDTHTKLTFLRILPNRINTEVGTAIQEMVGAYAPTYLVPDNDIAFSAWRTLETALGALVYFARPFKSTDKPLVENTNRWIRYIGGIPKKTDFALVDPLVIARMQEWFNHTPRECLGGMTPWEVYTKEKEGSVSIETSYPRHPVRSPLAGFRPHWGVGVHTLIYIHYAHNSMLCQ